MKTLKRLLGTGLATTLLAGIATGQDTAVTPLRQPVPRPTVSPYLSLLNRNASPAVNYYQLYRPQRRFESAYRQLNTDVTRLEHRTASRPEPPTVQGHYRIGATGHPTSFMSYGNFYPAASQR